MKADEYATKKERLSWLGRTGKTVQVSIDGMDGSGRNKGIVYEHLVFSRRVLKAFYRREFEIADDIREALKLSRHGALASGLRILDGMIENSPIEMKPLQPEDEIEIPEEVPAVLPWDSPEGGK